MFVQKIDPHSLSDYLSALDTDPRGVQIMSKKGTQYIFKIYQLHASAAHILKQESLSLGAEFALSREAILLKNEPMDGILIASKRQLEILIQKCKMQPFGLKELMKNLESHLIPATPPLQIMGIINANEDSFFSLSRFLGANAQRRIEQLIDEGAHIIDIGAASTRPGSEWVDENEELARVRQIAEFVRDSELFKRVKFSIDTYNARVAEFCLDCGFSIINDITALRDSSMITLAKERQCEVVIMHMQGENPRTMQQNPHYENVVAEVDRFLAERVENLKAQNITKITLDVGIGFGKNLEHNLKLIRHLSHFQHFGFPLLIGASRKSMIDKITPSEVNERLPGTLILHAEAYKAGASIIRCHDVKEHVQAFRTLAALESTMA